VAATNPTVELYYSGAWHDITSDVLTRDSITITRGRPDESSRIPPSTLQLTIKNTGGTYSPRNPMSPLYGLIGRNTPIRVSVASPAVSGAAYRFCGEVESWPQRWSVDGNDVWAPITANGIMRRLNAPGTTKPAWSALRRAMLVGDMATGLVAYWPMEGDLVGVGTTPAGSYVGDDVALGVENAPLGAASAVDDIVPERVGFGFSFTSFPPGNITLPVTVHTLTTTEILTYWHRSSPWDAGARPSGYTWDSFVVYHAVEFDSSSIGKAAIFVTDLSPQIYGPNRYGLVQVSFYDSAGTFVGVTLNSRTGTPGDTTFQPSDGAWHEIQIRLTQVGSDVEGKLYCDGVLLDTQTMSSKTLGRTTFIRPGSNGQWVDTASGTVKSTRVPYSICHVSVHNSTSAGQAYTAGIGHTGEAAAERIERLCGEEEIPLTILGDSAESEPVGIQRVATFLELLNDAADADDGILFEPRDDLGLAYRVHADLYNQAPVLELDYAAGSEVAPPLEPVEDTDVTANDVTVSRFEGGSARAVKETGTLNVQEPTADPDGVGRYAKDVELVLASDDRCIQQASWRRHLGTWDESRYPIVNLDLTAMEQAAKTALAADVVSLDVGDRFAITNVPSWLPPDDIEQHAQGFTEVLGSHRWTIAVNATPARPYDVFVAETDTTGNLSRIPAADGASTTNEALDATETGVDIISTTVRWIDSTNYASQFPFDITVGGERMRVTACSGTGLTQTFTVTRSINGVVKSHASGATVQLYRPPVIAR